MFFSAATFLSASYSQCSWNNCALIHVPRSRGGILMPGVAIHTHDSHCVLALFSSAATSLCRVNHRGCAVTFVRFWPPAFCFHGVGLTRARPRRAWPPLPKCPPCVEDIAIFVVSGLSGLLHSLSFMGTQLVLRKIAFLHVRCHLHLALFALAALARASKQLNANADTFHLTCFSNAI